MSNIKPKLNTADMALIAIQTLKHVCGHERDLDDALLVELESGLSHVVTSLRASLRARERGCVTIMPGDAC